MTRKKAKLHWGEEQQKVFDELKCILTHAPVLVCPDFTKPFVLQTDASDDGLGAMLTQTMDERERVIPTPVQPANMLIKKKNIQIDRSEFAQSSYVVILICPVLF